jgi:hypothetical protein
MPGRAGSGTPPGAARAGRGGADFVGRYHDSRASARSLRPAKLGGPRILEAVRFGMTHWKDRRDELKVDRKPPAVAAAPLLPSGGSGEPQRQALLRIEAVGEKARAVVRRELTGQPREHRAGAETVEIEVEVGMHRHELADVDVLMAVA